MAQPRLNEGLRSRLLLGVLVGGWLSSGCGARSESDDARSGNDSSGRGNGPNAPGAIIAEQGRDEVSAVTLPGPASDPGPSTVAAEEPPVLDPDDVPLQLSGDTFLLQSNAGEVDGALFMVKSPLGTTLELVEASDRICVRGELAPVPEGDYANYWGGEVGLVLVPDPTEEVASEAAFDVSGFAFRLEGALPEQLRFRVGAAGEVPLFSQYCEHVPLITGTNVEVALDTLTYECWTGGGAAFPVEAGATLLSWQIPANESSSGRFDFCIEDIRSLR